MNDKEKIEKALGVLFACDYYDDKPESSCSEVRTYLKVVIRQATAILEG